MERMSVKREKKDTVASMETLMISFAEKQTKKRGGSLEEDLASIKFVYFFNVKISSFLHCCKEHWIIVGEKSR